MSTVIMSPETNSDSKNIYSHKDFTEFKISLNECIVQDYIEQCLYRLNKFFELLESRKRWMFFILKSPTSRSSPMTLGVIYKSLVFQRYHRLSIRIYYHHFNTEYEKR